MAFPAYPQTDVGVRSLLECSPSLPEELRDALLRALGEDAELTAEDGAALGVTIGKALDSHVEAIAVRVAAIIQEQRAKDKAEMDHRRRELDLTEL